MPLLNIFKSICKPYNAPGVQGLDGGGIAAVKYFLVLTQDSRPESQNASYFAFLG